MKLVLLLCCLQLFAADMDEAKALLTGLAKGQRNALVLSIVDHSFAALQETLSSTMQDIPELLSTSIIFEKGYSIGQFVRDKDGKVNRRLEVDPIKVAWVKSCNQLTFKQSEDGKTLACTVPILSSTDGASLLGYLLYEYQL